MAVPVSGDQRRLAMTPSKRMALRCHTHSRGSCLVRAGAILAERRAVDERFATRALLIVRLGVLGVAWANSGGADQQGDSEGRGQSGQHLVGHAHPLTSAVPLFAGRKGSGFRRCRRGCACRELQAAAALWLLRAISEQSAFAVRRSSDLCTHVSFIGL